jgi:hypothetical protein
VAEEVANDGEIDPGLKQRNRAAMTKRVGRNVLATEARCFTRCLRDVPTKQVCDTIATERLSAEASEGWHVGPTRINDGAECRGRIAPERANTILVALAVQANKSRSEEVSIIHPHPHPHPHPKLTGTDRAPAERKSGCRPRRTARNAAAAFPWPSFSDVGSMERYVSHAAA